MKLDYLKSWGAWFTPLVLFLLSSVSLKAEISTSSMPPVLGAYTTVYLDSSGVAELDPNPTFYNPSKDSVYVSQKFFYCSDIGDSIAVNITVTDTSLPIPVTYYWDNTIVLTEDTLAPFIKLTANFAMSLNSWGYDTLRFNAIDAGSTDNCAIDFNTLKFSRDTVFNCSDIGNHFVWVSAADASGNVDSAMVTVTVNDALPPTLLLEDDTLYFSSLASTDTIRFSDIDDGSFDNCGLDSATLNGQNFAVFSCSDLGQNVINVQLWDINGNSSTATANIWVLDTVAPVYTKSDTVLYLNSTAQALSRNDFVSAATGGCFAPTLTIFSDTVFTCNDIATTPNYIVFQYTNGPLDSVSVSVLDTLKPNLTLQNDTVYLDGIITSQNIQFGDVDNGSFDNCGIDSALVNGANTISFSCADTGANMVTVQLWDLGGNLAINTTEVYVLDTVQPQYAKNDLVVDLILSTDTLRRSDFLSTANGGCFPPQLTILSDTVMDCSNAISNPNYIRFQFSGGPVDSVKVEVYDNVSPVILLNTHNLYLNNAYDTLKFVDVNNGSIDNCSLDSATLNGNSQLVFSCADLGTQKVVVRLWDPSGNMSIDSVNVTVLDTATPNFVKTPYTAYLISDSIIVSRNDILSNVSGGCFPPVISILSDTVMKCGKAQTNPNYILFSLNGGQADSVAVTVLDTAVPNLNVANDTIYLSEPNAQDSVDFSNFDIGSNDNCGIDSTAINSTQVLYFTCADTGAHQIVIHAWDASLNQNTDTAYVYVLDTASFNYSKFDQTVYIGYQADTLSRIDFVSTATAGCIVPVLNVLSDTVFDCSDIATSPSYIRFQFTNGPLDSVLVTVLDTVKPILTLQSDTLYINNALGSDSTSFADVDAGSSDNCGLDSGLVNGLVYQSFSCADTGANQIAVQLWDANGNVQTGLVTVYVLDTVLPVYVKTPHMAYLISDSVIVSRGDILSNATGGCFPPKLTLLSDSVFYCSDADLNPHYIRFQFTGGPIDSVSVTVIDTVVPNLVLKNDTVYLGVSGAMDSIVFANIDAASFDNCNIDSTTINGQRQLYFACTDTGVHTIITHAWDASGNESIDSVLVFVLDTVQPSYTLINVAAYLNQDSAVVSRTDFISNLQGGCFEPEFAILSDTVFYCSDISVNPHYIRFSVNGMLDSAAITVLDTVSPSLLLQAHTIYLGATDTLTFADIDNNSSDNCGLDSAQLNGFGYLVYNCSDLGTRQVNVMLYDVNGNSDFASVSIQVVDTVTPVYVPAPFISQLVGSFSTVSRDDLFVNTSTSCSGPDVTFLSDTTFDCSDILNNPNYVHFTLNGQTDSVAVTVVDTTPPTFNPKTFVNLVLSANGTRTLTMFDLLNSFPTDNCAMTPGVTISPSIINCSNTNGFTPIVVTASDIYGNLDSVVVNILAQDITPPSLSPGNTVYFLDSLGQLTINANDLTIAKDSCGVDTVYANMNIFSCADTGISTLAVTAIDVNNNSVFTNVQISVSDTTPPSFSLLPVQNVYLDQAGNAILKFVDIVPNGAFDGCGIKDTIFSQKNFSCANVAPQIIDITLVDFSGNSNTQQVVVTAIDTISPILITNNISVQIDSITGNRTIDFFDVTGFVSDNCELDSNSLKVTPNTFTCDSLGLRQVKVEALDIYGNSTVKFTTVEVKSFSAKMFTLKGPQQVCENAYNVEYHIEDYNSSADYDWFIQGGNLISKGHRGRVAYIHWNTSGPGNIKVFEQGGCSTGKDSLEVAMNGLAPDTALIAFWNPDTKTTLICTDQNATSYQWGYDIDSAGALHSVPFNGETKNSYYNYFIEDNIDVNGYRYWCETSYDGVCFTRSYFMDTYPVNISEFSLGKVEVWPVPFRGEINISTKAEMSSLILIDMFGKKILVKKANGANKMQIEGLENLPPGSYVLQIIYENGTKTNHKIVHLR